MAGEYRAGPALDRSKLLAARFRAASDRPYLASALYSLSVVSTILVPTMGVDRLWRCYVNPSFVDATPVPELAGVWIHEVAHLLRDHPGRAERLPAEYQDDRIRVNLAQDCESNDDLTADGIALPADHIRPSTFGLRDNLLFEQYLPDIPVQDRCPRCGSGAYGGVEAWDLPPAGATSVSGTEADAIRRITADAIRAHLRSRGTMPAGWKRWAESVLEPTVDWREVLAGSVRRAIGSASGAVDYTYQRPSRRSASMTKVVLPSLRRPVPTVAIVIDTSGSMREDDLAAALAEVAGVLRGVGIRGNRVTVFSCDAAVHVAQRVTRAEQIELSGGGGTDMRVGIEAALALPQRPDVIVLLTDGYTPWPEHPPVARVIAGLIGEPPPPTPDWIECVHIGGTS
jgi:predicted metal-dependent peptidase